MLVLLLQSRRQLAVRIAQPAELRRRGRLLDGRALPRGQPGDQRIPIPAICKPISAHRRNHKRDRYECFYLTPIKEK